MPRKEYSHNSVNKRVMPTREEQRDSIERSMLALLKRTRTTLQSFKFCEPLIEDIQAVLERHTEFVAGRPSQKHLKDAVRPGVEEEDAA